MSDSNTGYVSPYPESVKRRFEMKFIKGNPNECWEWLASRNNNGYGKMAVDNKGKFEYAHRISYKLYKGDVPDGKVVMHSCNNKGCVNPNHLSVGTYSENGLNAAKDGLMKNRAYVSGERSGSAKYTDAQIAKALGLLKQGISLSDVANSTGISYSHLSKLRLGKTRQTKQKSPTGKAYSITTLSQGVGDSRKLITFEMGQQIIEMIGQGMTQKQVAEALGLRTSSVASYLHRLRSSSKAKSKPNPFDN